MSPGRRKGRVHKRVSSRYYPPSAMPLILCGACLMVVLQSSEKARGIYNQIVESYRLPDIREAFNDLGRELPPGKAVAMFKENAEELRMRKSDNKDEAKPLVPDGAFFKGLNDKACKYSDVFAKWFDVEGDRILSVDFRTWLGLIDELIRVGFNNKSEQAKGMYKVTGVNSELLRGAIHLRAFGEYNRVELVNDEKTKAVRITGTSYDLTRFLADVPTTRGYRVRRKAHKQAGYTLLHDETIARNAWWWCQSRVVHSGPEEFCRQMLLQNGESLDASNVSREIRAYDEAIGYPRGK
jgi:hypothetical protein